MNELLIGLSQLYYFIAGIIFGGVVLYAAEDIQLMTRGEKLVTGIIVTVACLGWPITAVFVAYLAHKEK